MFNPTNLAISKSTPKSWQRDRHLSHKRLTYHPPYYRYFPTFISDPVAEEGYSHLPFSNPPQPEELEAYLGWTTRDVINEMKSFGYSMTLNVPESVIYLQTSFGRFHFYFEPEKSRISAVVFKG